MTLIPVATAGPRKGKVLGILDWVRMDPQERGILCESQEQAQAILKTYVNTHGLTERQVHAPV